MLFAYFNYTFTEEENISHLSVALRVIDRNVVWAHMRDGVWEREASAEAAEELTVLPVPRRVWALSWNKG